MDDWAPYGVRDTLKEKGIYDPEKITIQAITFPLAPLTKLPPPPELVKIQGDAASGKTHATR
ncbi:MAG: hypothetical protein ACI9R3_004257 [Verrucomicrobiales bacterium]|jgi:hypothetical protein